MRQFEIYLDGCTNPVYIYRSYAWLVKRLQYLCELRTLTGCTVVLRMRHWDGEVSITNYHVWFGNDVMGNRIWEA